MGTPYYTRVDYLMALFTERYTSASRTSAVQEPVLSSSPRNRAIPETDQIHSEHSGTDRASHGTHKGGSGSRFR